MIRKRMPKQDTGAILTLIRGELLPLTRKNFPRIKFERNRTIERLAQGKTFVAAKKNGPPVGFIHVVRNGDQLFIDMLAVSARAQGRGYGSALMDYAEEYGRKRGCRTAHLFVDDHNAKAQHFYEARGFRRERYVGELRCYEYRKSLSKHTQEPMPYPLYPFPYPDSISSAYPFPPARTWG